MNVIIQGAFILFLLILAAITSASEISIISTSRIRLRRMASEGSRRAAIILKMLETPERFFSTILVSNNVVDTLIAVLVTAIIIRVMGEGAWQVVASTVLAAFLIIFFEVTAKTIAASYSERISFFLARPMGLLIRIFSPLVVGFEVVINAILKVIKSKTLPRASLVTDDEIRGMIKLGQEEGSLQKEKYGMITRIFEFNDAVIRNVMTPKKDIFSINLNSDIDDILNRVLESGYSRIPVYEDDPESITGIINMKDLLMLSSNKGLVVFQDIVYPPTIVNESKKVTELLKEFQKGHAHLAIVVDGQNKLQGLVTLEDLVEEIVGDINDEYDVRVNNYKTKHV